MSETGLPPPAEGGPGLPGRDPPGGEMSPGGGARIRKERVIAVVLAFCAGLSGLVMVGMVAVLLVETVEFFSQVSFLEFLTETRWTPLFREKHFGVLPLLSGTFLVVAGAALVALPLGLLTAVYLSEYAGERTRGIVGPLLKSLSGIPTVVFGYFALTLVTPLLRAVFPGAGIFNAGSASLALGIMVLPTVASWSEAAMGGVSRSLREAAYGLGARRGDVVTRLVVPAALPGILASFALALSRAAGETMVVAIAAGSAPLMTLNPLDPVQTLSAFILQAGQGNPPVGTLDYQTLWVVGAVLFLLTMLVNSAGGWLLRRGERRAGEWEG